MTNNATSKATVSNNATSTATVINNATSTAAVIDNVIGQATTFENVTSNRTVPPAAEETQGPAFAGLLEHRATATHTSREEPSAGALDHTHKPRAEIGAFAVFLSTTLCSLFCMWSCSRARNSSAQQQLREARKTFREIMEDKPSQGAMGKSLSDPYQRPPDEDSTSSASDENTMDDVSPNLRGGSASNLLKEATPEQIDDLLEKSTERDISFIQPQWSSASVTAVLADHGIKVEEWPENALADLSRELAIGKARFCKRGDELIRVVDIVIVLLVYEPEHLVMQELTHPAYRRNFGEVPERTVKSRLLAGESLTDCAERCLQQKLGFATEDIIQVGSDVLEVRESSDDFEDSLPGLSSLTRMFVVEADVVATDQSDLEKLGLISRSLSVSDYMYRWEEIREIRHARKHLRQKWSRAKQQRGHRRAVLDHSLIPVMPWSAFEVAEVLRGHGVDDPLHSFGMELDELHRSLSDGMLSLGMLKETSGHEPDAKAGGSLVCVTERIYLMARSLNEQVLVRAPVDADNPRSILPSTQKWSNENISSTVFRLLQQQFKLTTPMFQMTGRVLATIDSVGSREGCIRREIVVSGPILGTSRRDSTDSTEHMLAAMSTLRSENGSDSLSTKTS